ncbi:MAG: hypothetical protein K2X38_11380, partial [Gemmataceae bacterium]|nr:hypothetical protein [Gemmataceae bacterium]
FRKHEGILASPSGLYSCGVAATPGLAPDGRQPWALLENAFSVRGLVRRPQKLPQPFSIPNRFPLSR